MKVKLTKPSSMN